MKKRAKKVSRAEPNDRGPRLYPYQRRWVEDDARFKIACKARQIGFTFAAAWRVVDKRLHNDGLTVWLSASERQALEAMEHIRRFAKELRVVAIFEEDFVKGTLVKQYTVRFPNRSRIVALPANPDTVRGFAGDVVLDEFAFHRDADAIWRAAFATATRGFQIEIISTPNGTRGKFYELARAAGLVDYTPPPVSSWVGPFDCAQDKQTFLSAEDQVSSPSTCHPPGAREVDEAQEAEGKSFASSASSVWSAHWVDLSLARTQGFVVDVESLRAAIDDEDAWQQEYCCRFLSHAAHYIPPELVVAAEHPAATTAPPFSVPGWTPRVTSHESRSTLVPPVLLVPSVAEGSEVEGSNVEGSGSKGACYLGVDIGRRRDLTVLWLLEVENDLASPESRIYWTRGVFVLERTPFSQQRATLDAFLAHRLSVSLEPCENPFPKGFSRSAGYAVRRCAIDASGLGAMLAEELQQRWGSRVEPVTFTLAVKEDLAVRVKRLLEDGRLRIPADPAVRAALAAVKRIVTPAGNVRFDADRTERAGHADHFWALALALLAADQPASPVEFLSTSIRRPSAHSSAF